MKDQSTQHDVVILGGGPAGTTVATLLLKYNPDLKVLILEKETFPREHVGESQLPVISQILDEMGVWDAVEKADFPIKLGASYTWGQDDEAWDFDFYPAESFVDEPRPASFTGQRKHTAFQVERGRYDKILLDHAISMGAEVRQQQLVGEVLHEGDRITGVVLDSGQTVTGRYYIDGTGHAGLIRRSLGVEMNAPTELRNIAMWRYWDNATWAVKIGIGGTRVQVRSLPWGWVWFIPLGPSRASVGLVCPSQYYKEQGLEPAELYDRALTEQSEIASLLDGATPTEEVRSCKNWSQLASRLVGENWFLCGEAAGFADPILAAGLTLTHGSAREVAYAILELERGNLSAKWVKNRYDTNTRTSIQQHIRFAQFWYAANGRFTDLQEYCSNIADEAGLKLSPAQAWRWLAQGGFTTDDVAKVSFGAFDIGASKKLIDKFTGDGDGDSAEDDYQITKYNVYKLNLLGAKKDKVAKLIEGRIDPVPCYRRGPIVLPMAGSYKLIHDVLKKTADAKELVALIQSSISPETEPTLQTTALFSHLQALEAMLNDGWVTGKYDKSKPRLRLDLSANRLFRKSEQGQVAIKQSKNPD